MSKYVVVDMEKLVPILDNLHDTNRLRGYGYSELRAFFDREGTPVAAWTPSDVSAD